WAESPSCKSWRKLSSSSRTRTLRPLRISADGNMVTPLGAGDCADAEGAFADTDAAGAGKTDALGARGREDGGEEGGEKEAGVWPEGAEASGFSVGAIGRVTVNAEPPAGRVSASISPPCSRMMDMQMLSPRPVPPPGRLVV